MSSAKRTPYAHWKEQKPLTRALRREQTTAEAQLWERLRDRRLLGAKFRRQHPIARFVVDFYCAEAALVVEVDGPVRDLTHEEDAVRQVYLQELGLRVIRFNNEQVADDMDFVLSTISAALVASR